MQTTLEAPSIRCGSCKGRHTSVALVRECYAPKASASAPQSAPVPVQTKAPARLDFSSIPDGNYAIRTDGVVKFYRVYTNGKWKNVQVRASDQLFDVRGPGGIAILHAIVKAGLAESQMLFATELGRCYICGRTLTDEESRARGTGPVCAGE